MRHPKTDSPGDSSLLQLLRKDDVVAPDGEGPLLDADDAGDDGPGMDADADVQVHFRGLANSTGNERVGK